MTTKKSVSVIVPTYNSCKTLERCLKSLVEQTFRNIDIVIIDDGSTDSTMEIIALFASSFNNVFAHTQINSGVSVARNAGIKLSNSEYIMFCDSDDFYASDYVETMVGILERDGSDLVISGYFLDGGFKTEKRIPEKDMIITKEDRSAVFELYDKWLINSPWNKIFKRRFVKTLFPEDMNLGEDLIFNREYIRRCGNISVTTYAGYHYLAPAVTSLAGKYRKDKFEISRNLHDEMRAFAEDCGVNLDKRGDRAFVLETRYAITSLIAQNNIEKEEKIKTVAGWISDPELVRTYMHTGKLGLFDTTIRHLALLGDAKSVYWVTKLALRIKGELSKK